MSSTPPPPEPVEEQKAPEKQSAILQPKMQQKISLRFAIGLFLIAGLLFGWYFLRNYLQDVDPGSVNSTGWIAAIRQNGSGQQAVLIKPDGTIVDSPDYRAGAADRDVVWQPDGQRVYFSSDRENVGGKGGYHIYRWNVSDRNTVDQKSTGTRAQEHPTYPVDGDIEPPYTQLIVSAGVVVDFNPRTGVAHQQIPIEGKSPTQNEEGGNSNQFGPEYQHLGSSYREAYWCKNRKYIAGIMRRDDGETLVIQCIQAEKSDNPLDDGLPHGIIAGEHIDMAIDPHSGNVVYSVANFRFLDPDHVPPEQVKNGKAVPPFRNAIGLINLDTPSQSGPIQVSQKPDHVYGRPQVSPDGSKIAFVGGSEGDSGFTPIGLFVCPLTVGNSGAITPLVQGAVGSICWSPDGKQLVFDVRGPEGKSVIAIIGSDGSGGKALTEGKGSFVSPRFSPTQPKSG